MSPTSGPALRYLRDDAFQVYRRFARPRAWAEVRRFRERPVESPETLSLAPMIARRAIFVHIPKCAGIAVNETLFGCRGAAHMPVALYRRYLTAREFDSFFKFTFVRNPWDRLVSGYHFLKDGGLHERDRQEAAATVGAFPDFGSFVEGFVGTGQAPTALHFRPQHLFLSRRPGGPPAVDFIGRVERFDEDFAAICARLGVPAAPARANAGRSRPASWRDAYTPRTAEIVAEAYARDVELFGYTF